MAAEVITAICVSIHARTRRATIACRVVPHCSVCFNPRPHAAGNATAGRACLGRDVSIHARTRRATPALRRPPRRQLVSIHARTRRATLTFTKGNDYGKFQSTPARGGRLAGFLASLVWSIVSIHARTRRATTPKPIPDTVPISFNPRPHAAGDMRAITLICRTNSFNPRPHAAGDNQPGCGNGERELVSIHARTRRATIDGHCFADRHHVSIHARTRRATSTPFSSSTSMSMFQSTPARGGRQSQSGRSRYNSWFQSTPARGGRQQQQSQSEPWQNVSIHARTRRATSPGIARSKLL